jgi:Fur family peroxide stress response transcriptional regulator
MNNFTNTLREHNLKATPQRLAIMNIVQGHGHINIDNLYEEVKKRFSSISLATIYKNINAMTQNLLLSEVKLPNEKSVYEIVKENHSHMQCTQCKNIVDIHVDTSTIIEDVSSSYSFQVQSSELVLSGVCEHCSK